MNAAPWGLLSSAMQLCHQPTSSRSRGARVVAGRCVEHRCRAVARSPPNYHYLLMLISDIVLGKKPAIRLENLRLPHLPRPAQRFGSVMAAWVARARRSGSSSSYWSNVRRSLWPIFSSAARSSSRPLLIALASSLA